MSIELDNSAATKLALPQLPTEMWAHIFSQLSLPEIMNFVNHYKHKASGKKEVSVDYMDRGTGVLVLKEILRGIESVLKGHAFSQVQLRKLYKEVFDKELEPELASAFVELVAKYRQDSKLLAISMNNPALLCSSDHMSNKLGINVTDWLRKDPGLFLDLVRSKLVKATAVHDTPKLNIPELAELRELQHFIDLGWSNVFLIQLMDTRGPIERAVEQIKNGADVEKKDQWGDTPLMSTFQYNDLKLVEYLIEKCGADVNKTSTKGKTVLMTAVHYNDIEAVKYLIKQCGADVEKQDEDGMTALIHAAYYNKLQVVEYLIKQCGADAEKQDKDGKTALMHAAKEGYLDMARCLVECGANPEEAKVALERAFGQEVFAELESLFLDVTSEKIFNEVLGPIVQEEAIAFVDMDSPLAGAGPDLLSAEQDFA